MRNLLTVRKSQHSKSILNPDYIRNIKSQTFDLKRESTILRSKTNQIKAKISEKEHAIKSVFRNPKDDRLLNTCSDKTIEGLKRELFSLVNMLESRKHYLDELRCSDKFWYAKELRNEILLLYSEEMRIVDEYAKQEEMKKSLTKRISDINYTLKKANKIRKKMISVLNDIDIYQEKTMSYFRGDLKLKFDENISRLDQHPEFYQNEKSHIMKQIDELEKEKSKVKTQIEEVEQKKNESCNELDHIIAEAISKIRSTGLNNVNTIEKQ